MANEFIIKNGFISKGDSIVNGTISGNTFNLIDTPVNNNGATEILVRNTTTGNLEYRDSSTLGGGGGSGDTITGFTYDETTNTFSIGVSGGTSFDSQILEVSGLTVANSIELGEYIVHSGDTNTYFGFNGTDSIVAFTNASRKLRIGTNAVDLEYNGSAKLSTISNGVFVDGRLGVGTDSPQQVLDVRGNGLISNPTTTTVLTLSGSSTNATYIDFDNAGASTPFARVEGRTYGGGTSGSLNFDTFPSGGALSQVMILTNNQRVGIGDLTNNDVEELLHVEGGDFLISNTQRFYSVLNTNTPLVRFSGQTDDLVQLNVAANNGATDGGVGIVTRGYSEASFPGYGKQGDGSLYSSIAQNGLNIISAPGTDTEDYIRFFAGDDANGTTPNMFIAGTGSTKGFIGINTETPTERLHIAGSIKIVDGTEQNGYVLTCDANGVGSWQPSSGGTTGGTVYWQTENGGLKSYTPTTGSINGTSTGAFIAGGFSTNEIFSSLGSTILNGSSNVISGSTTSALLSTQSSSIKSNPSAISDISHATIVGGFSNTIEDTTGQPSERATIVGGSSNIIDGGLDSAIIGGSNNTITEIDSGIYTSTQSVISGGSSSAIIGGSNHILEGTNSIILGGDGITGTSNNTVYVPNLNIGNVGSGTPLINLGLDSNGNIVTGTTSDTFTGNTSASCITDLWVTNIHSCSPLNINPNDEGNVYFGSTSGITLDLTNTRIGLGTETPLSKLHVNEGNALISNENGNLTLSSTTTGGGGEYENNLYFRSAGSISFDASIRSNSDGSRGSLYFATTPATGTLEDRMVITNRGRVGIGVMNPDSSLHISGSNIQQLHIESIDNNAILKLKSSDSTNAYIDFEETSGNRWLMGSFATNDKFVWATGTTFGTGGLMGLTQAGDLGIGNISPETKLHVNVSSLPSLPTLGTDNVALFESNNETEVAIVGTSGRNVTIKFGDENGLPGSIIYENAVDNMSFQSNSTTFLSSAGNEVVIHKTLELREFGSGSPTFNLQVRDNGAGGFDVVTGATGADSGNCITDLYVTNLESCSPLNINTQNQGNIIMGNNGSGGGLISFDITTPNEPNMSMGDSSFIRYRSSQAKLEIADNEANGKVVLVADSVDTLESSKTQTIVKAGDFETESGNIIVKSGNSKTVIIEDIPDVSGANLGTDVDGKLIDIPSDSRVKQNILDLNDVVDPLEFMQKVSAYQFEFKPETRISSVGKKHYGFKVDDFRDDLIRKSKLTDLTPDELVINNIGRTLVKRCKTKFTTNNHSNLEVDAMNYQDLIPFMVEGIKQLDTNINNISTGGSNKFVTTQTLSSGQNIINHNLNDENVIVQVIEVGTGQLIIPDRVSRYLPNSVAIDVEIGGEYKIIIIA